MGHTIAVQFSTNLMSSAFLTMQKTQIFLLLRQSYLERFSKHVKKKGPLETMEQSVKAYPG